jgi:hypothetical protein
MEYYYYTLKSVLQETQLGNAGSPRAVSLMKVLFDNWESMKFINHYAIVFYQEAANT